MFCWECGVEASDNDAYCGNCGASLQAAYDTPIASQQQSSQQASPSPKPAVQVMEESMEYDTLGPFELRGELGRGAMARVWRGWDPKLEREVAIKEPLFDPQLGESLLEEMGQRFVKEGRAAARLHHPGIVTIYATDVYDGRPAIVMELVEGNTLTTLLESGVMNPSAALAIIDQLLDAVGYAHAKGVVHRDIKPDNIFVDTQGRVKLADFGIAQIDDGNATRATMVGTVLGTPGYMSPEQATGAKVDERSDLFSIGVVAYELLAGENPFGAGVTGNSTALLYRIVHEPVPSLPDSVCAGLEADPRPAIMAALEKAPASRPQSAEEFKAALHGGNARRPAGYPASEELAEMARRSLDPTKKWLPYIGVAAACLIVVLIAFASATSGGNGGGGIAGGLGPAETTEVTATGDSVSSNQAGALSGTQYFVDVDSDGYIAIYSKVPGGTLVLEWKSDGKVENLSQSSAEALDEIPTFDSFDDALALAEEFEDEALGN